MKKFILSLFVGFVGVISFCSAVNLGKYTFADTSISANSSTGYTVSVASNRINCFSVSSTTNFSCTFNLESVGNTSQFVCFQNDTVDVSCSNTSSSSRSVRRLVIFLNNLTGYCSACPDCPICPSCPTCTGYNLNVVYPGIMTDTYSINSDINLNVGQNISVDTLSFPNISLFSTCQNLSGEICGSGDLLRSNIYINNILHPGRQFVNIEIPDYVQWDYSVGDDDFNLYVGSGYDVDYINSVIDINSYRPTSEDFTNVFVSGLTLVMPYIVIVLFIVFIRKLIKRIFK